MQSYMSTIEPFFERTNESETVYIFILKMTKICHANNLYTICYLKYFFSYFIHCISLVFCVTQEDNSIYYVHMPLKQNLERKQNRILLNTLSIKY